jgi:hypothetical protein
LKADSVADLTADFSYPLGLVRCGNVASNIGVFFIRVVEPIIIPDGVSPTMPFIVEVFSKCGMSFAGIEQGNLFSAPNTEYILAQSNFSVYTETFGECLMSLKQVGARPLFTNVYNDASYHTSIVANSLDPCYGLWSLTNYIRPNSDYNLSNLFVSSYRFFRGSMIYHAVPKSGATSFITWSSLSTMSNGPLLSENGNTASVRIPFWSPYKMLPTQGLLYDYDCPYTKTTLGNTCTGTVIDSWVFGDDFQLGYFTGFPPLVNVIS